MKAFQNTSIRRKQTLIIMATTSVALLLVCAALTAFEVLTFRRQMKDDLSTYANIVANNVSAAVDFDDPGTAGETLSALKAEPDIIGACVYSTDKTIFAQYHRNGTSFKAPVFQSTGYKFGDHRLSLYQPIKSGGQVIGVIFLESDTHALRSQLENYVAIILAAFIVTLVFSLGLSNWLQRLISEPILELVSTAREVAQNKNYSVRVHCRRSDEIGVLIDGFNEMLAQIQERDSNLERRVQERTRELARSLSILNATIDATGDGVLVVNAERKKVLQNRRAAQIWKMPSSITTEGGDAKRLQWVADQVKDREQFIAKVEQLYARSDATDYDEIELKDGTVLERITGPVLGEDGTNYGRIWTFRDVTGRKRAEAALAYERELLNALLNNSEDRIYFKDVDSRFIRCSRKMAQTFAGSQRPEDLTGKTDHEFFSSEHAEEAFADEQRIIATGEPIVGKIEKETWPDGRVTWVLTTKMPLRNDRGKIVGTFGISKDITEIKLAEAELNRERNLLQAIIQNSPDSIYIKDLDGRKRMANPAELKNMGCKSEAEALGKTDWDVYPGELAEQYFSDDQKVIQSGAPLINREEMVITPDGEVNWFLSSKIPLRGVDGKIAGLVGMGRNITAIKGAEEKLKQIHKQLMDASRQAGMAEVATSVLHNVGNVLNSANVSASLIADKTKGSKVKNVARVAALMRDHEKDLGRFLADDPKGKQLPDYLFKLADFLTEEQEEILKEINSLVNHIVHIKEIVAMQQGYARAAGVVESLNVKDLVEDSLRMNSAAATRHNITIIREFDDVPAIVTDKHRVLQILVNLIRNAKYACDDSGRADKQIILRVGAEAQCVKISVIDNGIGIGPENLTRIFSHGFTTRKEGHGFGLHSGAIAAREIGGALTAFSDGLGHGAAFTLELPLHRGKQS